MSDRDKHLRAVMPTLGGSGLKDTIAEAKILVVGAGGIGCELLKVRKYLAEMAHGDELSGWSGSCK